MNPPKIVPTNIKGRVVCIIQITKQEKPQTEKTKPKRREKGKEEEKKKEYYGARHPSKDL